VTDPDLIRAAVEASGLSARRFAERILSRDERTIRRWQSGVIDIPPIARLWLEHWLELSDTTRDRIVGSLAQ
jgi:ribosome-binding protein aMBF1 (putative translation factor)